MVSPVDPSDLVSQYQAGRRDFQNQSLRRADLHGLSLAGADFSGADLTEANLRDADLQGANLTGALLNGADLSGADLTGIKAQGASFLKTYLLKTNLPQANLDNALCTGAFLTRANLTDASLKGAFFNGANLTGAVLTGAKYNAATRFDGAFNPEKAGLKKVAASTLGTGQPAARAVPKLLPLTLTVEELLMTLTHLGQLGNHYLGNTMASRYWQTTRPGAEWFAQFEIDRANAQIRYLGSVKERMTPGQIELAQDWVKKYVKSCSLIFKEFPNLIEAEQLVFPLD
ncbi:MAG: pentapeptide repeat-containing protein [Cyanobacteria bacterium RI_101]|nr:pentapeptide repeat-containing protein [Cyanobacteria bacterium RI_101]